MALITTIEELKKYNASANLGMEMATFLPSCNYAEETYIKPELGPALYDALLAAYNASIDPSPTTLPARFEKLIAEVRKALAPLAVLHYKKAVITQLSDAGAVEKANEQGATVRMWVSNLQDEALEREGYAQIENLLAWLELNKGDYDEWTESAAYTEYKEFLMYTVALFNKEIEIGSSRKFFRKLRPAIKKVETLVLKKNIGSDMYSRLFAADLSNDEKALLKMCYPVIANFAMAEAALPFFIDENGIYIIAGSENSGRRNSQTEPSPEQMRELKEQFYRTGRQYLDELVNYLNDNASPTLYAQYYESDLYSNPAADDTPTFNEGSDKIFIA